jgi:hypothetical protein
VISKCASSASADRSSEDVGIAAIVVSELKFRDIQRQVFCADFVEAADHAALEDRPEDFNCVRADRANNILLAAVIDGLMIVFCQAPIDTIFVRRE